MTKIAMIGAGSTVFMKNLVGDILSEPLLKDCEIALMDIDEKRLATSRVVAERIAAAVDAQPKITATTDRRRALEDADYVVLMIQVAGYKPGTVTDFEVPKKHGLRQTIADTLGIGGIMRGLRTAPVLIDIARDMEELCPNALMLQYVNPMAINCAALSRADAGDPHRRPLPFRAGHGEGACARHRRAEPRRSAISAPASTTWRST